MTDETQPEKQPALTSMPTHLPIARITRRKLLNDIVIEETSFEFSSYQFGETLIGIEKLIELSNKIKEKKS